MIHAFQHSGAQITMENEALKLIKNRWNEPMELMT